MTDRKLIIAIIGATGAVGHEIIQVMNQLQIKFYQLKLFSQQSHQVSTCTEWSFYRPHPNRPLKCAFVSWQRAGSSGCSPLTPFC